MRTWTFGRSATGGSTLSNAESKPLETETSTIASGARTWAPASRSRVARRAHALAAAGALALALAACTSGLGGGPADEETVAGPSSAETGLGIDLGFELDQPIEDGLAIVGASLPTAVEGQSRAVAFVAFVTRAAADDADGAGTPLVRDADAPADDNDAFDVFLVALEDELVDTGDTGLQPVAFGRALVNTFRHDRCTNCHAVAQTDSQDVFPGEHPGGAPPISDENCANCHNADLVPELGNTVWRAPVGEEFDLRDKTLEELSDRAHAANFDVEDHLLVDGRVRWAIESGQVPLLGDGATGVAGTSSMWDGSGRDRGAVPVDYETFLAQVRAWRDGGFQATAAGSIKDVVLVSARVDGASLVAGNGASLAPSITWVPNPTYSPTDPGSGSASAAGEVRIAFASDSTDLTSDGSANRDVFLARVQLFPDRDPATGDASEGDLDLVTLANQLRLVSERTAGGAGGDGDSDRPVLDRTGTCVAFESRATDLVSGYGAGTGGGLDVYFADLGSDELVLVSGASGSATQGGAGESSGAALSPVGGALAFESTAADLVADDTNAAADVFWRRWDGSSLSTLERASVDSAGSEGSGGDCRDASIHWDADAERASIAFESEKTNLVEDESGGFVHVYLREGDETTRLSQLRSGTTRQTGNGDSTRPRISPTGRSVIFESSATNLDAVRRDDENAAADVYLVDLANLRGSDKVESRRLSVDSNFEDADGASSAPLIAGYIGSDGEFTSGGLTLFRTAALNLGRSETTDLVFVFLEYEGVVGGTDFRATPAQGLVPLTVDFESLASGDIVRQRWDFGDPDSGSANGATGETASHTYDTVGSYTVTLTVRRRDAIGGGTTDETLEKVDVVVVEPVRITLDFSATPQSGEFPLEVVFTNESNAPDGTLFTWEFGDGETATGSETVTHTYLSAGFFDVTLTASPPGQDAESLLKEDFVESIQPVVAAFSFDPPEAPRNYAVRLENESLGDLSTVTAFEWYSVLEDLVFSTAEDPGTHAFPTIGTHSVRLTLSFDTRTSTATETIQILDPDDAFIDFSPNPGLTGVPVNFVARPQGPGLSYAWDFGDGTSSNEDAPTHTYTSASPSGGFTVSVVVSGSAGEPSASRPIVVLDPSEASFTFEIEPPDENGHIVRFTDTSTGTDLDSWSWDFGDGTTSTDQNPTHVYAQSGNWSVDLTVDGESGESLTTDTVSIDAISYEELIHPILNAATSCHACHAPGGGLSFNFDATTTATDLWNSIFDVSAGGPCCTDEIPIPRRVDPFDSSASLLWQVLEPTVTACNALSQCATGADMNTDFGTIPESDVDLIRLWIDEGAEF